MTTPSLDEFNAKMDRDGWIVIPDVVSMNLVERMRHPKSRTVSQFKGSS